jgi:hypothetical protein
MKRKKNRTERRGTCPTCSTEMLGLYCYNCGEKRTTSDDYILSRFVKHAVNFFTHYDSKLLHTTRLLLTRPGFLTTEYFAGRRIPYVKPLQLFFLLNILYFFASSFFGWPTFATPLHIHCTNGTYGSLAQSLIDKRIHELGVSYEEYQSHFNHSVGTFSKSLIFIMVPLAALLLQGFYWRPRRFYVEHLVFSIHFFTFLIVNLIFVEMIIRLLLAALGNLIHQNLSASADRYGSIVLAVGTAIYLFFSMKVVYRQSLALTITKTIAITWLLFWVLWVYRAILFFVCFYFS